MTVAQLGVHWMSRRRDEVEVEEQYFAPGAREAVSAQTLAGYQHALSRVINPSVGELKLTEVRTGTLDEVLAHIDREGRSTRVARSVLSQMFGMAVRHDAIAVNPMREVRRPPRRRHEVQALTVQQAQALLALTSGDQALPNERSGIPARIGRGRSPELHDVLVMLLATGMRIGEALALEWSDVDLDAEVPTVRVAATLVEPRRDAATGQVFVSSLRRQPATKTGGVRVLAVPAAAVTMLERRRTVAATSTPVFSSSTGSWLWPNNQRTKLRGIVADTTLAGVTPHTLRRTVATLVAHHVGLDAARDLLGHRNPSITARHHVASSHVPVDVRHVLDKFFVSARPDPLPGRVEAAGN